MATPGQAEQQVGRLLSETSDFTWPSSNEKARNPCPIQSLPAEIRLKIFRHYYKSIQNGRKFGHAQRGHDLFVACCINEPLREEVSEAFFQVTRFEFIPEYHLSPIGGLAIHKYREIQDLTIRIPDDFRFTRPYAENNFRYQRLLSPFPSLSTLTLDFRCMEPKGRPRNLEINKSVSLLLDALPTALNLRKLKVFVPASFQVGQFDQAYEQFLAVAQPTGISEKAAEEVLLKQTTELWESMDFVTHPYWLYERHRAMTMGPGELAIREESREREVKRNHQWVRQMSKKFGFQPRVEWIWTLNATAAEEVPVIKGIYENATPAPVGAIERFFMGTFGRDAPSQSRTSKDIDAELFVWEAPANRRFSSTSEQQQLRGRMQSISFPPPQILEHPILAHAERRTAELDALDIFCFVMASFAVVTASFSSMCFMFSMAVDRGSSVLFTLSYVLLLFSGCLCWLATLSLATRIYEYTVSKMLKSTIF